MSDKMYEVSPERLFDIFSDRVFEVGDVVTHFKRETLSESEMLDVKYIYQIIAFAKHSETREWLVIYNSLLDGTACARPAAMFISEVDHEKYPDIKQKYRFEHAIIDDRKE